MGPSQDTEQLLIILRTYGVKRYVKRDGLAEEIEFFPPEEAQIEANQVPLDQKGKVEGVKSPHHVLFKGALPSFKREG